MANELTTTSNQMEQVSEATLISHLENMGLLKDLTAGEKNTYLQICKAYNLNPFKREIHVSKYNGQMSIITGYETYIKRAERSGVLDGWEVKTEGEVSANLQQSTLKAVITIYRKDRSRPFIWEAKFTEYMQLKDGKLNKFWQKSETMIKKVAMAQGFRLCFNDELGGMPYSSEEINDQAEDVPHTVVLPSVGKKALTDAITRIKRGETVLVEKMTAAFNLTEDQGQQLADALKFSEEIKSWLGKLEALSSVEEIDQLKSIAPAYIVEDASFTSALGNHPVLIATAAQNK
jgi:phage recombination protein Bet